MAIECILFANASGQVRLAQHYGDLSREQKRAKEREIIPLCLNDDTDHFHGTGQSYSDGDDMSLFPFIQTATQQLVYRKYASLYVIICCDLQDNEFNMYDYIQFIIETFNRYFENVCELDIMYNIDKAYFLLDEMVIDGKICGSSQIDILNIIDDYDKSGS